MKTGKYPSRMPCEYIRYCDITQRFVLNILDNLSSVIKDFGIILADDNKTILNEHELTRRQKSTMISFQNILKNNADYDTIFAFVNDFREIAKLDNSFKGISMSEWYVFLQVFNVLEINFDLNLSTIKQELESRCCMYDLDAIEF
jgi:hypothetical protein